MDWNLIFWLDGATADGLRVDRAALPPARQADRGRHGDRGWHREGADTAPAAKVSYLTVLRDRPYLLYMLAMLLNALIYVQAFAVLPLAIIGGRVPDRGLQLGVRGQRWHRGDSSS